MVTLFCPRSRYGRTDSAGGRHVGAAEQERRPGEKQRICVPERKPVVGELPAADEGDGEEHDREAAVEGDLNLRVCEIPPHGRSNAAIGIPDAPPVPRISD